MSPTLDIGLVDYRVLCPSLQAIEQAFPTIQAQYQQAQAREALRWVPLHWDMGYSGSRDTGTDIGWNTALLLGDVFNEADRQGWHAKGLTSTQRGNTTCFENASHLPCLTDILMREGLTRRAALTRVQAGTELPWHRDWDPAPRGHAVIRVLWGLDVPQEHGRSCFIELRTETQRLQHADFADNRAFVFWSECEHRVVNQLSATRVVIGLDLVMPMRQMFQRLRHAQPDAQGILLPTA